MSRHKAREIAFKYVYQIAYGQPLLVEEDGFWDMALEEDNMEIIDCVAKSGCCCPTSKLWKKLFDGINEILDGVTLKDISEGTIL